MIYLFLITDVYTIFSRREPVSLIKPTRSFSSLTKVENNPPTNDEKSKDDFELNKKSSKATRHLYLIRHGQYQIKENEPEMRVLTQLGIL